MFLVILGYYEVLNTPTDISYRQIGIPLVFIASVNCYIVSSIKSFLHIIHNFNGSDIRIKTINLGHIATYIFQNAQLQLSCIRFTLFLHK